MRFYFLFLLLTSTLPVYSQLERKLENADEPELLTFHAPRSINIFTVEPLDKKNLHFAIMHTFGTIDGGVRNLWGLDNGANIRLSFEYGLTDKFSVGFGRSSQDQVYDFFGRFHIIQQTQSNKVPVSISIAGNTAFTTADYSFLPAPISGSDRQSYFGQIMVARRFSNNVSLQVAPMLATFNSANPVFAIDGKEKTYAALAFSGKIKISNRTSITSQWILNTDETLRNNVGVGIDIEAGGHAFQFYFVTNQSLTEQYILASDNGQPGDQFRIGFNVNRIFKVGK